MKYRIAMREHLEIIQAVRGTVCRPFSIFDSILYRHIQQDLCLHPNILENALKKDKTYLGKTSELCIGPYDGK